MKKRPKKLSIVAWLAIFMGGLSFIGASGALVAVYVNEGTVYLDMEYSSILQIIFSAVTVFGGIGILLNKAISQKILTATYSALLFVLVIVMAKNSISSEYMYETKIMFLINTLVISIPVIFSLYVLQLREIKLYFHGV